MRERDFHSLVSVWLEQCWGSWHFGTDLDPCLWPMDPDPTPDPAFFVPDLQDINKNYFFCFYYFLKVQLHNFSKIKKIIKKSQNSRNLAIFAWWEKDPDPDPYLWLTDPDPGGPKTYRSRSPTLVESVTKFWSDFFLTFERDRPAWDKHSLDGPG